MDMILRKLIGKECVFYTNLENTPAIEGRVTDINENWIEVVWNGGVNPEKRFV